MMDSHTPAAAKSLVPFALAFAVVTGVNPARAQPSDNAEPSAPSAPAPEPEAAPTQVPSTAPVEAPTAPAAPPAGPNTPTAGTEKPITAMAPAEAEGAPSWFTRAPLTISSGEGDKRWALTFYGFVEASYIMDSTRSYADRIGAGLVARDDTYDGQHGRTQFSIRNTRLGLKFESPVTGGIKPSAVLEADFYGPDTNSDTTPERTYYDAALFRIRHAYMLLENDYVDVLAGQTYDVFGWQNSRSTQFRLSHNFGASTGPVTLGIAAAAVRPVMRDSGVPDLNAGIRLNVNSWKGMITTVANSGSLAEPLFLQVSGVARQYKANAFAPSPVENSNSATGWGVSIDVLIPVIPAKDSTDRSNRLTLTGSFVNGSGIADLININGGAMFPTLSNPAQANPAPVYDANVDQGLVTFDTQGVLHTIDWQAIKAGIQYYFPGSGRVFMTANYIQGHSANMVKLFPRGGAEIELLGRVANTTRYGDVSLYWDATPAVRFGITGAYTKVDYLDGDKPHNIRGVGIAQYAF